MPPLKQAPAALLLGALILLAAAAVPSFLSNDNDGEAPAGMHAADLDDLVSAKLPPPPTLRLLSPEDAQGTGETLRVSGEAASERSAILDVQYRLDGSPWQSLPGVIAGAPVAPFTADVPAPPGDHVIEVRAYDGNAYSIVSRASFRAAPTHAPTVRILEPADGQGVTQGSLTVTGTVESPERSTVTVRVAGNESDADVTPGPGGVATWRATVDVPAGVQVITAHAPESLPVRVLVAAAPTAPPTLRVLSPANGSAYGSGGDEACRCIPFAGIAPGANAVLASLDGAEPERLVVAKGGAWAWTLGVGRLLSGEHQAVFTPLAEDGTQGAPRVVTFTARTAHMVRVSGDDAPRPTHTTLQFGAQGEALREVAWKLDGENLGTTPTVTFRLPTPGLHVLTARTLDAQGRVATLRIPLWALNQLPTATLAAPTEPIRGEAVFQARGEDPDGRVVSWRWDFGDGTTATGPENVTHVFPYAGAWRVNATPVDDQGAEGEPASALVTVLNHDPRPMFTYAPDAPTVRDVITFFDASADHERRLAKRTWDFSDGTEAEGPVVAHRFTTRGPHLVKLTVTDQDGGRATFTRVITLDNVLPRVGFVHLPQAIETGTEVLFVDRAVDEDGRVLTWHWDFGHDCPTPCDALHARTANASRVLHVFPAPGTYQVNLTVGDDASGVASRVLDVIVHDALPSVRKVLVEPETPRARQEVRFRAEVTDPEGAPSAFSWDFGDGHASDHPEPTHAYARSGVYPASVNVTDAAGQTSRLAFPVVVHNAKPNATLRLAQPAFAGHPALLDAQATDADGEVVRHKFDADGDGVSECDGAAPRCAFTYPEPGRYVATLAVADDEGASILVDLEIEVQLPPPNLTPPTVIIEAPQSESALAGRILVRGTAGGVAPIRRVEVQLRNDSWTYSASRGPWTLASGTGTWHLHLDTRSLADGEYVLVARATDARNASGETRVPVLVANGPRASMVSVQLHNAPIEPLRADHDLLGSAWHPDGAVTVRSRIDDGPWRDVTGDPAGFTIPLVLKDLAPGPHVLRVDARRSLSDQREEVLEFRVADAPPALVVDEPPNPVAYGLLKASGRLVGEGKVLWRVDHDVWRELPAGPEWHLSLETQGIRNGPHELWLKATSLDGVETTEPVKHRIRVINPAGQTEEERRIVEQARVTPRDPDEVDLADEARRDVPAAPVAFVGLALLALALVRPPRGRAPRR